MIMKEEIAELYEDGQLSKRANDLCQQLLKERDEALARAEAYREVALKNGRQYEAYEEEACDAEAARILAQKKSNETQS